VPRPTGRAYSAPPDPVAELRGRGGERSGKRGKGKEEAVGINGRTSPNV